MKQHITPEQLNELSEKGKERLRKWWKPQRGDFYSFIIGKTYQGEALNEEEGYDSKLITLKEVNIEKYLPLLSIGQMIEFLDKNKPIEINKDDKDWEISFIGNDEVFDDVMFNNKELCDALWETVKEVLNAS